MYSKEQLGHMRKGVVSERKKHVKTLLKICVEEYLVVEMQALYGKENTDLITKYIDLKYKDDIYDYLMCMETEDLERKNIPDLVKGFVEMETWEVEHQPDGKDKSEILKSKIADVYRMGIVRVNRELTNKINELASQADLSSEKLSVYEKEISSPEIIHYVSKEDLDDLRSGAKLIKETDDTINNVYTFFDTEKSKHTPILVL